MDAFLAFLWTVPPVAMFLFGMAAGLLVGAVSMYQAHLIDIRED